MKYFSKLKSGDSISADLIKEEGQYPVFGGNELRGYTDSYTHKGRYVLIGRQGALCGNINFVDGKFWASEHAIVATIKEEHSIVWLGELLRTMNLNQYSQSAAQPGLAVQNIQNLLLPVPSLNEQKLIGEHINSKTSQIDAQVEREKKSIQYLQEYRTALISDVVTGKIDVRECAV